MHVFKRGSVYWFELVFEGKRIQRSTKSKNQRAAGQIASAFHTALAKGEVGITERKPVPRFGRAMQDFLKWSEGEHLEHPGTATRYRFSSAALLRFFKDVSLDSITPEDVESFKSVRASEKGSHTGRKLRPATVNRELACLKALFNHAIKGDVLLRNPVSRVKFLAEQNQQNRVLSFPEQRRYLAAASPTLRDVATLILETGMRPEEVFAIEPAHVNLENGYLVVPKGKTPAARRRINLTSGAQAVLRARLFAASAYLFPCDADPSRPVPNVHGAHHRALKASGVPPFRLYDCRHTFATRAAECGVDLVTLASMLGHSRIQMVMRYAHPGEEHRASATAKLEAHNAQREIEAFGPISTQ